MTDLNSDQKYGLIGHPINHSLSPVLFRSGFNGLYRYDLIETDDFEAAMKRFMDEYAGINITAPFKEKAFEKALITSAECFICGSCNVLKKTPQGIYAANTDYLGVIKSLLDEPSYLKVRPHALIVGCGGAGKAAAYAACELGNKVTILNRDIVKAVEFAERLKSHNPTYRIEVKPLSSLNKCFRKAGIIIYTLPVSCINSLNNKDIRGGLLCKEQKIILEANYKDPTFTAEILEKFKNINPGIVYISGKEWLLHQAVEAFEIFTGEKPDIEKMRKVL